MTTSDVFSAFREAPTTFNAVLSRLDRSATGISFMPASTREESTFVSYATLAALVRGNALHFASLRIARGTHVAIALETDLEHVVALLALMALGAVPVSMKPRRGSIEAYASYLARVFGRFGIEIAYRSLLTERSSAHVSVRAIGWEKAARSDDVRAIIDVDPEDVALVQFSSGSFGDPKAVPIRHAMLMHNLAAILGVDGRTPDYLGYNFLPLSHDMGLVGGLFSNLVLQNDLVLSPVQRFLRRPADIFERYVRSPAIGVAMPDFALRHLVRYLEARAHASDTALLAPLHAVYCGAEPIRHATVAAVISTGAKYGFDPRALVFCYGLAEATLMVTARSFGSMEDSFRAVRSGRFVANVGKPNGGTEIRIDEAGILHVRGPGVFHGYLDDRGASAVGRDGWHDTGDIAFVCDGDVHVAGRAKELVIVGGENVFAADIEDFVARLPGVAEALVMTEDDRFYVFIVRSGESSNVDASGVAGRVGAEFGAFPAGVATGLPSTVLRTTSGKPMRAATLAQLCEQGLFA